MAICIWYNEYSCHSLFSYAGGVGEKFEQLKEELEERYRHQLKGKQLLRVELFENTTEMQKALVEDRNQSQGEECHQQYLGEGEGRVV